MRLLLVLACGVAALTTRADSHHSQFATSGRIVTIEQWGGRMNEAKEWAVLPTEIVVYRVFSSYPHELFTVVPIEAEDAERVRRLVGAIDGLRGQIWTVPEIDDGSALRISFTDDGSLRNDRIELENN